MSNENQLSADIGGLQKLDYTIVYHFKYIVIIWRWFAYCVDVCLLVGGILRIDAVALVRELDRFAARIKATKSAS